MVLTQIVQMTRRVGCSRAKPEKRSTQPDGARGQVAARAAADMCIGHCAAWSHGPQKGVKPTSGTSRGRPAGHPR